ncbi:UNVERIFIED_CONTAM: DNA-binding MarR family transcriptional regulator [Paenibacillus sp. PvR008]
MNTSVKEVEKFQYLILAVQRQGNRMFNALLNKTGVTPSYAEVIRVLELRQPLTLKDLGNLLICETGSPSRLVERMVKDGWIEKMIHPEDSRFVLLKLTIKGQETAEKVKIIEGEVYGRIEEKLSEEEMQVINDKLGKFLQDFPIHETLIRRGYL